MTSNSMAKDARTIILVSHFPSQITEAGLLAY
jgi:hypothetical protein